MTLSSKFLLAAAIGSTASSFAASIPKTILPDNIVRCEPDAGCVNQTHYGRNYKVMVTPRFTVMVSISHEGIYTRADISVTNNTDMPLSVSPEDFRVEVVTPKPKVLLYVPPAELNLPPRLLPPPLFRVCRRLQDSSRLRQVSRLHYPPNRRMRRCKKLPSVKPRRRWPPSSILLQPRFRPARSPGVASTSQATRKLSSSMSCCPSLELSLNSRMR